jgi:hypothetical protein
MTDPSLSTIPSDVMAAMRAAARFAQTGQGDPTVLRRIREEAERITQEVFERHGVLDISVPAIRELRDIDE